MLAESTAGPSAFNNERYGGSASYLFSQGTNITAVYARQEQDAPGGNDSHVYMVKLGHKWGPHALAVQYSVGDDVTEGYRDTSIGIAYNLELTKANTNLYASYLHDELDTPAGVPGVQDHDTLLVGARVRFD